MTEGAVALMLHQDIGPGGKAIAVIVMAGRTDTLGVVLRDIENTLTHGVGMGVAGEIVGAMTIRAPGRHTDGMLGGVAHGAGHQGAIPIRVIVAVGAVGLMGGGSGDQVAGMAASAIQGRGRVCRCAKRVMILVLMTSLEARIIGRMTIRAAGIHSHGMGCRCPVTVATSLQAAIDCQIKMTVGAGRLVHLSDHLPPVTAGTLGNTGQGNMGGMLMGSCKIGGVSRVTDDTGPAMAAVDGLVVDGLANGRAAAGVVAERPATTDRHVTGAAILVDGGDIVGVGVHPTLIVTPRALGCTNDPTLSLMVNAVARILRNDVDLVTMTGGAGGGPVGRDDLLDGDADGVGAAIRGVAEGVVAQGTVAVVLHQDGLPGGEAIAVCIVAGGTGGP